MTPSAPLPVPISKTFFPFDSAKGTSNGRCHSVRYRWVRYLSKKSLSSTACSTKCVPHASVFQNECTFVSVGSVFMRDAKLESDVTTVLLTTYSYRDKHPESRGTSKG